MKIAHISILPSYSSGIFKKIEDKAKVARKNNLQMDFYLLNLVESYQVENFFAIRKSYNWLPTDFLKRTVFKLFKMNSLVKLLPLDDYDAIVLRYPLVDGFGYRYYAQKYGNKTFTEHHTDEISELFAVGRVVDKSRACIEKYCSGKFISQMVGIVAVTNEIREIELKKLTKSLPALTLANGIHSNGYPLTGFIPFDGKILNMVFIASKFEPWQGLEMLIKKLKMYNKSVRITLQLIGSLSEKQREQVKKVTNDKVSIYLHGSLYGDGLNELMKTANIGISSLALSKKNMTEACPLKSREYIVRRLPFIYAYKDTDLSGSESFAKYLDEKNYCLEDIITFAKGISENVNEVSNEMKEFASVVNWDSKLSLLSSFISKQLRSS